MTSEKPISKTPGVTAPVGVVPSPVQTIRVMAGPVVSALQKCGVPSGSYSILSTMVPSASVNNCTDPSMSVMGYSVVSREPSPSVSICSTAN
jgi:hypothetical protein